MLFGPQVMVEALARTGALLAWPASAVDCRPMIDDFNAAVEASNEAEAQKQIDRIAISAECGRYQVSTQLGALRLSAAQLVIRRERPLSECERLLGADRRVEWRRE
jgi:hypothetical protein